MKYKDFKPALNPTASVTAAFRAHVERCVAERLHSPLDAHRASHNPQLVADISDFILPGETADSPEALARAAAYHRADANNQIRHYRRDRVA